MARYCGNCGNEVFENAYICPKCGVVVNNKSNNIYTNNLDKGGFGWVILGFFFPVVGLILYLVWKNEKPKTAKSAGKGAIISTITGVIFYTMLMILFGIIFIFLTSGL